MGSNWSAENPIGNCTSPEKDSPANGIPREVASFIKFAEQASKVNEVIQNGKNALEQREKSGTLSRKDMDDGKRERNVKIETNKSGDF